jgi:hypothetical protein
MNNEILSVVCGIKYQSRVVIANDNWLYQKIATKLALGTLAT